MQARSKRVRPHLDDKILTAWNGLMISAFAHRRRRARRAALRGGRAPRRGVSDRAPVRSRDRHSAAPLPRRATPRFPASWTTTPCSPRRCSISTKRSSICATWNSRCASPRSSANCSKTRERGGFFSSAAGDASLVLRVKEDYDGAEPSGNSVAVMNLLRLAQITDRDEFRESAERTLAAFAPRFGCAPVAIPQMLAACEFLLGEPREIILVGSARRRTCRRCCATLYTRFVPHRVVLLVDSPEARQRSPSGIPSIAAMQPRGGTCAQRTFAATTPANCPFPNRLSSPS